MIADPPVKAPAPRVEQPKPVQGAAAFIPKLAKRALENENPVPNNNRSIPTAAAAKIHAAAPSATLGVSGISFDSIARKKIKLPTRGSANNTASAPPIQTRTRVNISELTGTSANAIPELMAAFNVNLPPRKSNAMLGALFSFNKMKVCQQQSRMFGSSSQVSSWEDDCGCLLFSIPFQQLVRFFRHMPLPTKSFPDLARTKLFFDTHRLYSKGSPTVERCCT